MNAGEPSSGTLRRRGTQLLLLGTNALLAVGCFVTALWGDVPWQARVVVGLLGLLWLTWLPLAWHAWSSPSSDARPAASVRTADGASVVDLDPTPMRGGLWVTAGLTAVVVLAMGLGVADGEFGASMVLGLPFLAVFALPALDLLLAVRRGASVALSPSGVRVRGWRTESGLAWTDVAGVDVDSVKGRAHYRVRGLASGHSWTGRHLPRAWPAKDPLRVGEVLVPVEAVGGHGPLLFRTIQRAAQDPAARSRLGTEEGTAMLLDPTLT